MIKDRQHTAMLEHGTVYLYIHKDHAYNVIGDNWVTEQYLSNSYSVINTDSYGNYHITTNYRVLYENDWLDDLKYLCEPAKPTFNKVGKFRDYLMKLITKEGEGSPAYTLRNSGEI